MALKIFACSGLIWAAWLGDACDLWVAIVRTIVLAIVALIVHTFKNRQEGVKFGDTPLGMSIGLIIALAMCGAVAICAGGFLAKCASWGHDTSIDTLKAHTNDPYARPYAR